MGPISAILPALLTYKDDVDLNARLAEWEAFYNYHRPHGSLGGKTPYLMNACLKNAIIFAVSRGCTHHN